MNLSFTTIVLNEADRIPVLVESIKEFVDEMVFVDTGSDDNTVILLKSLGCKVLETTMEHGFSAARNVGLGACSSEWILSLDADEAVSPNFMRWCAQYAQKSPKTISSVSFVRQNFIGDVHTCDETHVRLFRRRVSRWQGKIHESVVVTGGRISKAHEKCVIKHSKTTAMQEEDNERYLAYYPRFNLGSGGAPIEGWINIDIDPDAPDAVVADAFNDLPGGLPAAQILASHILEHASYHQAASIVSKWVGKLAPGGTIEIRVPDLAAIVKDYQEGELGYLRFIQLMYGGQNTSHDYHFNAVDLSWLKGQLFWWGCTTVKAVKPMQSYELRVVGRKEL